MKKKNNLANEWIGTRAKALLGDLHASTGIPKSTLLWCGLSLWQAAGTTERTAVIEKHAKLKAKGSK